MRFALVLGVICAVLLHAGIILFGGVVFRSLKKDYATLQQVELLSADDVAEKDKMEPDEPPPEKKEELETETEKAPDAAEIIRNLEIAETDNAPALDEVSLSAIEAALSGQAGGGGDFAQTLGFSSGGRIGGTGKAGGLDEKLEEAFTLAEIDQKPRPVFQAAPSYPGEMRSKKLEGTVTVVFVVDPGGKVSNPRVEKSSHAGFEKSALDAVRKWRFEAAVRGGQRVACKMRVPIRFQPS